jgi:hypothetical protein
MKPTEKLTAALDAGNITLAKNIANSAVYCAEIEAKAEAYHNQPKAAIDTTAADNATKRRGFDYERAILAREERVLHSL